MKLERVQAGGFPDWAMADGDADADWIIGRWQAKVLVGYAEWLAARVEQLRQFLREEGWTDREIDAHLEIAALASASPDNKETR